MRIAIATAVYAPMINGVAVFSHELAKGLAARGNEVMVLCPSQEGWSFSRREDGVLVEYVGSREVKLYPDQVHAAKKKPLGKLGLLKGYEHGLKVAMWPWGEVARALDEFWPEVVHVQTADLIGLAAERWARRQGVPVVATEHNQAEVLVEPIGVPKWLRGVVEGALSGYFRWRMNRSAFATMPTQQAIENLIEKRGKGFKIPVAAVSNGVDLAEFRLGKAPAEIYQKYGIREGVPTVLYVGRVDPEKKVGVVLEAFKKVLERLENENRKKQNLGKVNKQSLKADADKNDGHRSQKENYPAQLVIVGDGVARKGLEKKARELGLGQAVRFVGRVVPPDLYEIYRVGDVFATASEIETQGIVLIEAAASGLPLIAVDKGAVREICVDEKDGILCRPGDVEGMATAMERILTDEKLRKKMSQAAVAEAKKHDFERTLDQFTNIYERVRKMARDRKVED